MTKQIYTLAFLLMAYCVAIKEKPDVHDSSVTQFNEVHALEPMSIEFALEEAMGWSEVHPDMVFQIKDTKDRNTAVEILGCKIVAIRK